MASAHLLLAICHGMDYSQKHVPLLAMPYSFESGSFGELASDADRLAAGAIEHEHRLASLVETLTGDDTDNLRCALVELCAGAREQQRIASSLRTRLKGDLTTGTGAAARPLVLVVDDSQDNRDLAAALLETSGFDTITAGNGLEGVIVAHCTRPAVVIMDVTMPVLDGVRATELLKASPATQDISVIAYTGKLNLDDVQLSELFVGVLRKPASADAMIGLVQRLTADARGA